MSYFKNLSIQYMLGSSLSNWIRILWQNKFKIYWKAIPKALYLTIVILLLTPFRLIEIIFFNRKIEKTVVKEAPVFILGHWRSGTTFLVNILSQDDSFAVTNAIHCFAPNIFLTLYKPLEFLISRILPKKRPMDEVVLDTVSSHEEEFAIANMSAYSNYHILMFPENRYKYMRYATFHDLSDIEVNKWKKVYNKFIKKVTIQNKNKRLLLKSPTNTSRIKELLELYPDAKFINICRDPYTVFFSTKKHYEKFFPIMELQKRINENDSEEFRFEIYEKMYRRYFEQIDLIPKGNFVNIKYEELVKDPIGNTKKIYETLNLGGFEKIEAGLNKYLDTIKDYKTNKHNYDKNTIEKISQRCEFTIKEWGYDFID